MKKLLMVCLLASSSFGVAAQPQAPDKLSPPTGGGDVTFNRIVVDANNAGDCKAIADVDGDGKLDLIVGGSNLAWYRNPDWIKTVVATPQSEFSTDCQAMDMNGDGRVDLITADGGGTGNVVWLENRATGTWPRHTVGSHGEWAHDIEVADFDGDGKLDVLTHGHGFTHMWYQNGADSWSDRNLTSIGKTNEGIGIGDVDGDGRIDMVQGGWWYKNPQNRTALWTMTQFASGYDGGGYTAAVADINRDGRADIAVINQHSRGEFAWYTGPLNPTQTSWTKNVVSSDIGAHKLTIIDLNGDGSLDFVAGLELTELRIYLSNSAATPTFTSKTINTTGCHNTRVGDVTGDGRVDLLCNNYLGNPPVQLYINQAVSGSLVLNKWQYIGVDMSKWGPVFGLAFGDINRDGKADILAGRHFYRNPGGNMTGTWARTTFSEDADAMLVLDVDGDGQLDVIAENLPNVYWLKPNADGSAWTPRVIAQLPSTSHTNGQGYRLAKIVSGSAKLQIVLLAGDGVYYLTIPANPLSTWPVVKIASGTSEDLLATADINHDGLDDVVASNGSDGVTVYWYQNPGNGTGNWVRRTVGTVTDWGDRAEIADINGDGRLDIVVSVENGGDADAETYWFQAPSDPTTGTWTKRTIAIQGSTNSLSVGDFDGDGSVEIVTGEHRGQLRVRIWKTTDKGLTWTPTLVSSGQESHLGVQNFDLDGDGDLDIVSIAYDQAQNVHLWRNDAK